MKTIYEIKLIGCDDSTCFEMELTNEEAELLKCVSELSQETSTYHCMPILRIEEKSNETKQD